MMLFVWFMKNGAFIPVFFLLFILGFSLYSEAQLVRRKDYDAAFALQAGGETGALTVFRDARFSLRPIAGLKMTFPFTRKWFLGSEVNYSELKYRFAGYLITDLNIRQFSVPVYLKYMLNCNKASVLFGLYGSYVMKGSCTLFTPEVSGRGSLSGDLEDWCAGITVGYEHQIVKHLHLMCRISGGLREVVKKQPVFKDKLFPLQACLTLSYDILRIGDCGCD